MPRFVGKGGSAIQRAMTSGGKIRSPLRHPCHPSSEDSAGKGGPLRHAGVARPRDVDFLKKQTALTLEGIASRVQRPRPCSSDAFEPVDHHKCCSRFHAEVGALCPAASRVTIWVRSGPTEM